MYNKTNEKELGWFKREKILVDHERHDSVRIENSKQLALKIDDVQYNKWKRNGWFKREKILLGNGDIKSSENWKYTSKKGNVLQNKQEEKSL